MHADHEIKFAVDAPPEKRAVSNAPDLDECAQRTCAGSTRRLGPICFEGGIPSFVKRVIEPVHDDHFRHVLGSNAIRKADQTHSYVHLQRDKADVVLRYRIHGRTLYVMNEGVRIAAHDIAVFAEHVLAHHPKVGCIRLYGADTDLALLRMPMLKLESGRHTVVDLPPDRRSFWSRLNPATREEIKACRHTLARDQGKISLLVHEGEDIDPAALESVLSMARRNSQTTSELQDQIAHDRMRRLARQRGLLLRLTVNGRLAAGAFCLRIGNNWRIDELVHDPALSSCRLDLLCACLCIEESIKRGATELYIPGQQLHLPSGLLGRERKLFDLAIYRSRSNMALQPGAALLAWSHRLRSRARGWIGGHP